MSLVAKGRDALSSGALVDGRIVGAPRRELAATNCGPLLAQAAEQAQDLSLADELLASWDVQRWQLERGAGGDHDKPYRFTLPAGDVELRSWLRLLVRYRRPALGAPEP